jgi:hypothetical protein
MIWPTFALTALLTAGQDAPLALKNVRVTQGVLGPARADTRFLPGDSLIVSFDIEGVSPDAGGRVLYSTSTEVTDGRGQVVFRQPPRDLESVAALGGGTLPAYAQVDIGLNQPAGDYTLKVTVKDRAGGKSQALTQEFQVLPRSFGLVRVTATPDAEGQIPGGLLGAGQSVWVNAVVTDFARAPDRQQPHVRVELRILDEQGRTTLAKPFSGTVDKDVPSRAVALPVQFLVALNRPGKFTAELKATDRVSGKTTTASLPLTVQPGK